MHWNGAFHTGAFHTGAFHALERRFHALEPLSLLQLILNWQYHPAPESHESHRNHRNHHRGVSGGGGLAGADAEVAELQNKFHPCGNCGKRGKGVGQYGGKTHESHCKQLRKQPRNSANTSAPSTVCGCPAARRNAARLRWHICQNGMSC